MKYTTILKIIGFFLIILYICIKLTYDKYIYTFLNLDKDINVSKVNNFNYNFNSILFYFLLLTLFFIFIKSIFYIDKNFKFENITNNNYYLYLFIIYIILGLFLFISILYHIIYILYINTNRFNKKLVKNNIYLVSNIILILIITYITYKLFFGNFYKNKGPIKDKIINNIEEYKDTDGDNYLLYLYNTILLNIYNSDKYFIIFVLLCLIIIFLYLFNPFGFMDKYATNSFYIILFCLFISFCLIYFYRLFSILDKWYDSKYVLFIHIIYILFSLIISGLLLYWIFITLGFTKKHKQNNPIRILFNVMLIIFCLSIIYKLLELNNYLDNKYFKLFLNILFYIPCIFINLIDMLIDNIKFNLDNLTKDTIILFLAIILITIYIVMIKIIIPKILIAYYTQGGKQFLNCDTVPLNIPTNIATYDELNDINEEEIINDDIYEYTEKIYYNSCLSFWFYIDSLNTSANSNYNKYIPILIYGNILFIKYNASNNTLQITNVKYITDTIIETETILYEHNNILLQKWNNLVLNYNSGTLDIFLNNILVKTIINFTNYVKYDSLITGYNNGIYGNICNILYFKKSLDIDIIKLLYDLYKKSNPPCLDLNKVKKII